MNVRSIVCGLGLVALTACGSTQKQASPDDMQKMMQDAAAFAAPGKEHAELAATAGTFDVEASMDMGEGPAKSALKSERTAICGGRFVLERDSGTMMGMPFEGCGITGFDNRTQEYMTVWMDSMGTYMMSARGKKDPKTGWVEMRGTVTDSITPDGRPWMIRTKYESANKFMSELWDSIPDAPNGKLVMRKVGDMTSTRAK